MGLELEAVETWVNANVATVYALEDFLFGKYRHMSYKTTCNPEMAGNGVY